MRTAKLFVFIAVLLTIALIMNFSISRRPRTERVPTGTLDVGTPSEMEVSTAAMAKMPSSPVKSFPKPGDPEAIEIEHGLQPLPFGKERPYDIRYAEHKGARGKLTILVVDVDGKSVDGASVYANFFTYGKDEQERAGTTDSEGRVEVEALSCGDMWFSVNKPGYYETRVKYWFFKAGFDCVKDGRWIPWNPVLEVVLKEVRRPVDMNINYMDIALPQVGMPFGYDLVAEDLVNPYGKGKTSDIVFKYDRVTKTNSTNSAWAHELTILFTNATDGVILTKLDTYSQMRFPYVAPLDGYVREVSSILAGVGDKILTDKRITDTDGLIFRIRSQLDERGKSSSALYGKILGPVFVNGSRREIRFEYYLNKEENERSIEAAGSHP